MDTRPIPSAENFSRSLAIAADTRARLDKFARRLVANDPHPFSADFLRDAADAFDDLLG